MTALQIQHRIALESSTQTYAARNDCGVPESLAPSFPRGSLSIHPETHSQPNPSHPSHQRTTPHTTRHKRNPNQRPPDDAIGAGILPAAGERGQHAGQGKGQRRDDAEQHAGVDLAALAAAARAREHGQRHEDGQRGGQRDGRQPQRRVVRLRRGWRWHRVPRGRRRRKRPVVERPRAPHAPPVQAVRCGGFGVAGCGGFVVGGGGRDGGCGRDGEG